MTSHRLGGALSHVRRWRGPRYWKVMWSWSLGSVSYSDVKCVEQSFGSQSLHLTSYPQILLHFEFMFWVLWGCVGGKAWGDFGNRIKESKETKPKRSSFNLLHHNICEIVGLSPKEHEVLSLNSGILQYLDFLSLCFICFSHQPASSL